MAACYPARDEHGSYIVMEFLDFGGRGPGAYDLGAGLAKMHLAEPTVRLCGCSLYQVLR